MISKIKLHNIATYGDNTELVPRKINYIFGGNGTGKTSISKLLHSVSMSNHFADHVEWTSSAKEKILVFNRFFIRENFEQGSGLNGVFTLGEGTIKFQKEIEELENKIANYTRQISTHTISLQDLDKSISEITSAIEAKCWSQKLKYGTMFPKVFEGFMNSKSKFVEKIISTLSSELNNCALSIDELQREYDASFVMAQDIIPTLSELDMQYIDGLADDSLLVESIIGSSHGQVGELITKLNSADWVKGGIHFAHKANGVCPYCQQPLSQSIQKDIEDYFDESYKNKCALLEHYLNRYKRFIDYLRNYRNSIPENTAVINYIQLQDQFETLITIAERNLMTIEKKVDNPSQQYNLLPITEHVKDIRKTIGVINESIISINRIVSDKNSKGNCKNRIWMFCAQEISCEINQRQKECNGKKKGIENLKRIISQLETEQNSWRLRISEIESKISSVEPTVKAINCLLTGFGFEGFMLEENTQKSGTYRIVRPDGTEAKDTLSEGEYNFISFLYFYHLCFGSTKTDDITREKIIVIDDPISSLDSNVMFIVSSLTKDILRRCKDMATDDLVLCHLL